MNWTNDCLVYCPPNKAPREQKCLRNRRLKINHHHKRQHHHHHHHYHHHHHHHHRHRHHQYHHHHHHHLLRHHQYHHQYHHQHHHQQQQQGCMTSAIQNGSLYVPVLSACHENKTYSQCYGCREYGHHRNESPRRIISPFRRSPGRNSSNSPPFARYQRPG